MDSHTKDPSPWPAFRRLLSVQFRLVLTLIIIV
jgi:hypothetical protein